MRNSESANHHEPVSLARWPVTLAAVLCGFMAFVGLTAAVLALVYTPGMDAVTIYDDRNVLTIESKWTYLLAPPVFLIFAAIVVIYYAITWSSFARYAVEIGELYKTHSSLFKNLNLHILFKVVFLIFIVFQGINLYAAIYRISVVLNSAGLLRGMIPELLSGMIPKM